MTSNNNTIRLVGAPQSPYSRKMRSAMRYRQIPFQWVRMGTPEAQGQPKMKIPGMVPVLWFSHEDANQDHAMLDSTFQLKHLETLFDERSLYPQDPAIKFIASLLEDFADEWLTKCMFHYRWHGKADIDKAGTVLPLEIRWNQPNENIQTFKEQFSQRQIERLWVVGSNPNTKATIENSFRDVLKAMDSILTQQAFLLGERPSAADFAFMGQLVCLSHFDPTPSQVTMETSPRVFAWVEALEDLSGEAIENRTWISPDALKERLSPLLKILDEIYLPFLLGNANALQNGDEKVACEIRGATWEQKPFPYQGKCLQWLREDFAKLSDDNKDLVKGLLSENSMKILSE